MNFFRFAVVCVAVVAMSGCDDTSSQPQAPPSSEVGESQVINDSRKPSEEQVNEWANQGYAAVHAGARDDARKYFRLAAMNGHIDAAQNLENQLGGDDIVEAYAWGAVAASSGIDSYVRRFEGKTKIRSRLRSFPAMQERAAEYVAKYGGDKLIMPEQTRHLNSGQAAGELQLTPAVPATMSATEPILSLPPINSFEPAMPESVASIGMEFKLIPAGTFIMGEGDQAHEVTLTKPFKMGVHEVTQAQYKEVMGINPSPSRNQGAENPVGSLLWKEAVEFCRKLSEIPSEKAAGNNYRLPTEAEWEYACRATSADSFCFGKNDSDLVDYGWFTKNSGSKTHPVGSKTPNAWGLYDMHGNVAEWCSDVAEREPYAPGKPYGVTKGGSYSSLASGCRAASRSEACLQSHRYVVVGFRVVLVSPDEKAEP